MRLISGIDTAMPDVRTKWNYHARWNQNERFWQEDFRQLADCGFDLLRWQVPWSLVQPKKGEYRWDLIDPKVELAAVLGWRSSTRSFTSMCLRGLAARASGTPSTRPNSAITLPSTPIDCCPATSFVS